MLNDMTRNYYGQRSYNGGMTVRERTVPEYRFTALPADAAVTMAYVPMQTDAVVYEDASKALSAGTLFPCLDKPFRGAGDRK